MIVTLAAPERLTFNVTLNKPFAATDQLQSILISKPAFINSTAATLSILFDSNSSSTQMVCQPHASCHVLSGLLITWVMVVNGLCSLSCTLPQRS